MRLAYNKADRVSVFGLRFATSILCLVAYSSGRPTRSGNGVSWSRRPRNSSVIPATIGVSKVPGAIDTARIPWRARSRARGSVIAATAPFDAE